MRPPTAACISSRPLISLSYGLAIDLGNTNIEEMTPGGVVIKKDLWLLDGSYQLNGTRILDAIRREEEL